MKDRVRVPLLTLGAVGALMILGANIYQAVVEVPNWAAAVPESVLAFRATMRVSHPGFYFQVAVPITALALLGGLAVSWKTGPRWWALGGLLGIAVAEVFTLIYFFPRNEILFFGAVTEPTTLQAAATEWSRAHLVRMAVLAVGAGCALRAVLVASRTPTTP